MSSSTPTVNSSISLAGVSEDSGATNLATFDLNDGDVELSNEEKEAFHHIRNIVSQGHVHSSFMPALSGTSSSTEAHVEEQPFVSFGGVGEDISAR
ncbi:hypothetical protein HG530_008052 [Fusarium avenaceum]|nr:hypothetical protein HG530_008052 [Fusarium avenaceum]